MSCWVVPAVAAELWGMPLARVLEQMRSGEVPSKTEYGFALVDVAPQSPRFSPRAKSQAPARAPTYVGLQQEPPNGDVGPQDEPLPADEEEPGEFEEGELHWKNTRRAVSLTRRGPRTAAFETAA